MMKFLVIFALCCLALASAAPQFIWPGFAAAGPRTIVAGPTVVNDAFGGRFVAPGYVGPYF
ncbi:uncharacterized protein LOC119832858 [Zerene cesonia]|uniref:uncharacterized protein LOC119832858 n=1 Tax=Zerene cesonia TaxID=33412 RepID=UPI0018E580AE|nr:uncharacterized protein LOC119832858 [Zerene cesonia]